MNFSQFFSDQINTDQPPFDDSDLDSGEEDAYDLREVSSDVEMNPDDLDGMDSDARLVSYFDPLPASAHLITVVALKR